MKSIILYIYCLVLKELSKQTVKVIRRLITYTKFPYMTCTPEGKMNLLNLSMTLRYYCLVSLLQHMIHKVSSGASCIRGN